MKHIIIILLLLLPTFITRAQTSEHGPVNVHPDNRYLQYADGTPFFYLGDTAWELFHRLTREEMKTYMADRQRKGYTVIQAVCLAELDGLRVPNVYGELPFKDEAYTIPNEKYFELVDYGIELADSLGLVIGLLPTWGDKFRKEWGVGPVIFNTESSAETFGKYLGMRYKDKQNIIWLLGGDRPAENHKPIIRAMARGIATGISGREDYNCCLMTYHPWGASSSSAWLHDEEWLDFNMQQNGHSYDREVWQYITADYNRLPVKPVMDGEPLYDEHPIDFNREKNGTSTDYHVRRSFYHSVFSGACGHTYGCHAIWQMWQPGREPVNGPLRSWQESLPLAASYHYGYGKELIMSRPYFTRIPAQDILVGNTYCGHDRITATRCQNGSYAMVYSESGKPFSVNLTLLTGNSITAWWFDVRSGRAHETGTYTKTADCMFYPPTSGQGNDWVLVLDDADYGFTF